MFLRELGVTTVILTPQRVCKGGPVLHLMTGDLADPVDPLRVPIYRFYLTKPLLLKKALKNFRFLIFLDLLVGGCVKINVKTMLLDRIV